MEAESNGFGQRISTYSLLVMNGRPRRHSCLHASVQNHLNQLIQQFQGVILQVNIRDRILQQDCHHSSQDWPAKYAVLRTSYRLSIP